MDVLVTGGAGFIGRWVVKKLLSDGHNVVAFDNPSNGSLKNIAEFETTPSFTFIEGDIKDEMSLEKVFDVTGTFNVLEQAKNKKTRVVFTSTCMVYDRCYDESCITENHPLKPALPYAASKIAGESSSLSYYCTYDLPVTVVRPFNTYGPFQKSSGGEWWPSS